MTSWQGLPGDGFGGLDRRERAETFRRPYQTVLQLDPPDQANGYLEHFPLVVWSSQSLLGQWWGTVAWSSDATDLAAGLDARLFGELINPLPVDIEEAYLVYDRWAIKLGRLARGARLQIDGTGGIDLQTRLTGRQVVQGRNVVTAWEQSSTDVDRIMQLVMFYRAAKGQAYTRLQHRFQRKLDWSGHVTSEKAVLWGRSRSTGAVILMDGSEISPSQEWTYFRLLIPVSIPGKA